MTAVDFPRLMLIILEFIILIYVLHYEEKIADFIFDLPQKIKKYFNFLIFGEEVLIKGTLISVTLESEHFHFVVDSENRRMSEFYIPGKQVTYYLKVIQDMSEKEFIITCKKYPIENLNMEVGFDYKFNCSRSFWDNDLTYNSNQLIVV